MKKRNVMLLSTLVIGGFFLFTACSHTSPNIAELKSEIRQKDTEIRNLANENSTKDKKIASLSQDNHLKNKALENYKMKLDAQMMGSSKMMSDARALLPPKAQPGECFARVFVPNEYKYVKEEMLKKEAGERLEIIPAKYETVTEKVLVKERSEKLEIIPAAYDWIEETVLVRPPSKRIIEIPAAYENVSEKVLVREAHLEWKKGTGPVQKINEATGEIMCLVEEPAIYKTVTKRVLKSPASSKAIKIPAEYKTIKKRVMKTPPTTRVVTIPAEYKTVEVVRLVEPAREHRIPIPAKFQTITKKIKVSDGHMEWRPILCETNMTRTKLSDIQRALKKAGFDPGPIDGVIGMQTMRAINTFQKEKGLAVTPHLTMNTLKALNVSPR